MDDAASGCTIHVGRVEPKAKPDTPHPPALVTPAHRDSDRHAPSGCALQA
jgi:hypothetical protein